MWTEFFRRGSRPSFYGHAKFETKRFFVIFSFAECCGLLIFQRGGLGINFSWSCQIFKVNNFLEFFHLKGALDSEFFAGGIWVPTFLGYAKFEVKNCLEFFNLQSTVAPNFFQSC